MDKILKIQSEIGVLSKTETNPFFKSKYLDINGILANLQPLLEKYELTVVQPLSEINGRPAITTHIYDKESKLVLGSTITLPDLTDPQKMGSAITYYRRYSLQSLFLLQAEDDDGNKGAEKVIDYDKPKVAREKYQAKNKADMEAGKDPLADDL